MITASTPKTEKNQILQNLKTLADRRVGAVDSELKLLYVTVCFKLFLDSQKHLFWSFYSPKR